MMKIKFVRIYEDFYFETKYTNIKIEDKIEFDAISCERIDSKFVKQYFGSENYTVDKRTRTLTLYDKHCSKYTENFCKHRNISTVCS